MDTEKVRKLAASCRSLATSLAAGSGPTLDTDYCILDSNPCCAFGWALSIAGGSLEDDSPGNYAPAADFIGVDVDDLPHDLESALDAVSWANDTSSDFGRPLAVVNPLQCLAKYLDILASNKSQDEV